MNRDELKNGMHNASRALNRDDLADPTKWSYQALLEVCAGLRFMHDRFERMTKHALRYRAKVKKLENDYQNLNTQYEYLKWQREQLEK